MSESLMSAVTSGDRRAALEAMRDRLARELDTAEGTMVAVLSKELRVTIAELDALPGGKVVSPVDDLSARREARRAEAQGGSAAGGGQ